MAPRLKCIAPSVATIDTRIARPLPKRADPFYLSPAWRSLVRRITEVRGCRCQGCGREGVRLSGDHVHEVKDGGAKLDPANIQLLCGSCHSKKTARVRAQRMAERYGKNG